MLGSTFDYRDILAWLYKACEEHEAILGLTALAFIISMPPALPGFIGRIETLQWFWKWLHDGLLNLVSLQHPTGQTSSVTETRSRSVSIDATPAVVPPIPHLPPDEPTKPAEMKP